MDLARLHYIHNMYHIEFLFCTDEKSYAACTEQTGRVVYHACQQYTYQFVHVSSLKFVILNITY